MTTFKKDDIPDTVDTIEKLQVWLASVNYTLNKERTHVEPDESVQSVAELAIRNVKSNNTVILAYRCTFKINENYLFSSIPVWQNVKPITDNQNETIWGLTKEPVDTILIDEGVGLVFVDGSIQKVKFEYPIVD